MGPTRILVVGLPKSGTTILTYRIAEALDDVVIEFEPAGGPDPEVGAGGAATVITKKLVGSQTSSLADFGHYDRKIWICRDPRDFLVSQSLYRWHRDQPPTEADRQAFERVIAQLRAKEADPSAVPFQAIEPADYSATFDAVAELWRRHGDDGWFLYRYEDMVDGRYEELNRYLGFEVEPAATVASGLERVARRKESGDWRMWFTDHDVAHYRSGSLADYMATFGYDHEDWALDPEPRIEPEHGSRYVEGLFEDHRRSQERSEAGAAEGTGQAVTDASPVVASPADTASAVGSTAGVTGLGRRVLGRLRGWSGSGDEVG